MNAKTFRCLVLFCCTAAAGLVAAGVYFYAAQWTWVKEMNSAASLAQLGAMEFKAPERTSNAFYIAGLFLALGGCFYLKGCQEKSARGFATDSMDEPSIGDEN